MLDKTILAIDGTVKEEYARAAVQHGGAFASRHEGYAVLLEEFEEAREELNTLEIYLLDLWVHTKDDEPQTDENVRAMKACAVRCAAECVQIAAMCEKLKHSESVWKEIKE